MMSALPQESIMRYRPLLLAASLFSAVASAQGAPPTSVAPSDRWSIPAAATSSHTVYRDALSSAADDAQRFNFSDQSRKDPAPPDQSPVRVIINNGRGAHVNCIPMGVAGACH